MTNPKPRRRRGGTQPAGGATEAAGDPPTGLPAFDAAVARGASPEALVAALDRDFEGLAMDCWAREFEALNAKLDATAEIPVLEIDQCNDASPDPCAPVDQRWWIEVQGPLVMQAEAIAALKALAKLEGVEVISSHLG